MTTKTRLRTVFDLTPQELHELRQINLAVMATVPPARPRRGSGFNNYSDYAFDYGIYERYKNNHALAKQNRSDWIRSHRVNRQVVLQGLSFQSQSTRSPSQLFATADASAFGQHYGSHTHAGGYCVH